MKASAPASLLVAALLAAALPAAADDGCVITPTGIDCSASGSSTTPGGAPGTTTPGWPLRFLGTTEHPIEGPCWFWSPFPPGLDSWDSANDQAILWTRWVLPECPDPVAPTGTVPTSFVVARAWEVFRSFPLAAPRPAFQPPEHGITGLPTCLSAPLPGTITHTEVLPDGRTLRVRARVTGAYIDWGDGTPAMAYAPRRLLPYPRGAARHTYALKTCDPGYRVTHPSGRNCHPVLQAYPVSVTFRWIARYRVGGAWVDLGHLDRTTLVGYDVDEVLGVLQR